MIISVDSGKAFDKIQHHFMIESSDELGVSGTCLQS
jgi:hypothetical protein